MSEFRLASLDQIGQAGVFAGIGSRRLTQKGSILLMRWAFALVLSGYKERSGAADGSDTAHEIGAKAAYDLLTDFYGIKSADYSAAMEVYLPWENFNGRKPGPGYIIKESEEAMLLTSKYHPGWPKLSPQVKNLMSRNAMQVLGRDLDFQAKFIACSTPDGVIDGTKTSSSTGGTGQALRIGSDFNVPIFNIENKEHRTRIESWINRYFFWLKENYGIDAEAYLEQYFNEYTSGLRVVQGDLIDMAEKGQVDVLVHGCNIHNVKGSGFAEKLFKKFPEAYAADQATKKGDAKKLGTYSFAKATRNNKEVIIINAYTQLRYSHDPDELNIDYEALRTVMKKIFTDFKGMKIHAPKIGTGLASGCWLTISNILEFTSREKANLVVVDFPKGSAYRLAQDNCNREDKYHFFYSKYETFSQWHPSIFIEDGKKFHHCEQYMMYQKALLFNDKNIAEKILLATDPGECKSLGRAVSGFNDNIWVKNRQRIVIRANILKFTQNENMLRELIETENKILVEASPSDRIWGIGLTKDNPDALIPSKWRGLNLLGKCLEQVRSYILNHDEEFDPNIREIIRTTKKNISQSKVDESKDQEVQLSLI